MIPAEEKASLVIHADAAEVMGQIQVQRLILHASSLSSSSKSARILLRTGSLLLIFSCAFPLLCIWFTLPHRTLTTMNGRSPH